MDTTPMTLDEILAKQSEYGSDAEGFATWMAARSAEAGHRMSVPVTDEQRDLLALRVARGRERKAATEKEAIARRLVATRTYGIQTRVAKALGVTSEAVRQKYAAG